MIKIIDCTTSYGYSMVTMELSYKDIDCMVICEVTHNDGLEIGSVSILELYLIRQDGSLYDVTDTKFESKLEFDYGDIETAMIKEFEQY